MLPTIRCFMQALQAPDLFFATLTDAQVLCGPDGLPQLHRTTHFAEAEIVWREAHWLLSLPLHPAALLRSERLTLRMRHLDSPALPEYRILPQELRHAAGGWDLVLERMPAGTPFAEALQQVGGSELLAAIDALEAELRRVGWCHRNLKPGNLRWNAGRLYPLRCHDATIDAAAAHPAVAEEERAAFEALRGLVRERTACTELHDAAVCYTAVPRLAGHGWVGNPFEGLVCVEDEAGFGYVDLQNRPVIPAQFVWAGDFHEGRAEVQTAEGMGLIDRTGAWVLPPVYEIVEYDPATSRIRCRRDGLWASFDYTGRQLTEFERQ